MATSFFNGAFFNGEFFFGTTPVVVVTDTHDPGPDQHKKRRETLERLRKDILVAFEAIVEPKIPDELQTIVAKQVTDSVYVPLAYRIDWNEVAKDVELFEALKKMLDEAKLFAAADEDDLEALIL